MPQFIQDIQDLRRRAVEKMEEGAVTQSYRGDVNKSVDILDEALATEIVCVLRLMHHYVMATGLQFMAARVEFKEDAYEEREHVELVVECIQELGGKPDFNL